MLPRIRFAALLPAVLVLIAGPAPAAVITDGFESGRVDPRIWAPCPRAENRFFIDDTIVRSGRYSAGMALLPTDALPPPIPPTKIERRRSGCLETTPGAVFTPEDDQRAELWLQSTEPAGTDRWYGFSFRIDQPAASSDDTRLVIGQWKQSGDASPVLAQRFKNGAFHITVEQDGPASGQQCRVLVAWQAGYDFSDFPGGRSFLHGGEGTAAVPDGDCRRDLVIDRTGPLPSPFGRWVDMVVHLRAANRPDDIVEIWADGHPVATVRGPLGRAGGDAQYFKFGPYRDPSPIPLVVHFDNFSRGDGFTEVDPRRFDR